MQVYYVLLVNIPQLVIVLVPAAQNSFRPPSPLPLSNFFCSLVIEPFFNLVGAICTKQCSSFVIV